MDLTNFPTNELRDELRRREREAAEEAARLYDERVRQERARWSNHLDALLDLLPEHDRSDCADDNTFNSGLWNDRIRCKRCTLLDIKETNSGEWPENLVIHVNMDFRSL